MLNILIVQETIAKYSYCTGNFCKIFLLYRKLLLNILIVQGTFAKFSYCTGNYRRTGSAVEARCEERNCQGKVQGGPWISRQIEETS